MAELQSWRPHNHSWSNSTEAPAPISTARSMGRPFGEWEHQINALSKINFSELPFIQPDSAPLEGQNGSPPRSAAAARRAGGVDASTKPGFSRKQGHSGKLGRVELKRSNAKGKRTKKPRPPLRKKLRRGHARRSEGPRIRPEGPRRRSGGSENRRADRVTTVGDDDDDDGISRIFSVLKKPFSHKGKHKDNGKGETIWLESQIKIPGSSSSSSSSSGHGTLKRGDRFDSSSSSSSVYPRRPNGKFGTTKKKPTELNCSIGRIERGDDAALITLGSIGIPLAIAGVLFSGPANLSFLSSLVTAISTGIQNIVNAILGNGRSLSGFRDPWILWLPMMWPSILRKVLKFNWDSYIKIGRSLQDPLSHIMWNVATSSSLEQEGACFPKETKDLGSDMEFIDENEIVLRMLDDLMMTYKYGYVPKCTRSHICKLNKAAASGGQPQSTIVPLMSLPAAWLLGKPSSNVMDFLHAVWLGRNEKDCDEVYPECSDIYSSLRFRGGGANSTDTELEADLHMDELLNDLRYLEENNQMAPAAETNQDRKEDDPKEEKTT